MSVGGSDEQEQLLVGGNVTAGVVRVDDTVRRPRHDAADAVHAFLRHLERCGVPGIPRFLGVDERGREILSFHDGATIWPNRRDLVGDDRILGDVAILARKLHAASSSFAVPPEVRWWPGARDPLGGPILLHGDFAPWNLIVGDAGTFLIDWDAVSPGRREWELAYVLHTFVPLHGDLAPDDAEVVRRVQLFANEYGLDPESLHLALTLVPRRCRQMVSFMRAEARHGVVAFKKMIEELHDVHWLAAADHVERRLPTWLHMLRA